MDTLWYERGFICNLTQITVVDFTFYGLIRCVMKHGYENTVFHKMTKIVSRFLRIKVVNHTSYLALQLFFYFKLM